MLWLITSLTVSAEKFAGEKVINDASPSSDGNIHVIRLFAEPVQIIVALGVLGFPRRLLREFLRYLWLFTIAIAILILMIRGWNWTDEEGGFEFVRREEIEANELWEFKIWRRRRRRRGERRGNKVFVSEVAVKSHLICDRPNLTKFRVYLTLSHEIGWNYLAPHTRQLPHPFVKILYMRSTGAAVKYNLKRKKYFIFLCLSLWRHG